MAENLPVEQNDETEENTSLFRRSTWYLILAGLVSGIAYVTAMALLLRAKKEAETEKQ